MQKLRYGIGADAMDVEPGTYDLANLRITNQSIPNR